MPFRMPDDDICPHNVCLLYYSINFSRMLSLSHSLNFKWILSKIPSLRCIEVETLVKLFAHSKSGYLFVGQSGSGGEEQTNPSSRMK